MDVHLLINPESFSPRRRARSISLDDSDSRSSGSSTSDAGSTSSRSSVGTFEAYKSILARSGSLAATSENIPAQRRTQSESEARTARLRELNRRRCARYRARRKAEQSDGKEGIAGGALEESASQRQARSQIQLPDRDLTEEEQRILRKRELWREYTARSRARRKALQSSMNKAQQPQLA